MVSEFQLIEWLKSTFPSLFDYFNKNFPEERNVALAVSWWSDSMFLATLLYSFWMDKWFNSQLITILHCNHKVREESNEEETYLKEFFKNKVNFICFERENSWDSTEEALREWRYGKFNTYCKENNIHDICFWHNLTDRIETSLMNLIRWCWLKGFLNMKTPSSHPLLEDIVIHRPLLHLSKKAITWYCKEYHIPYFEDRTNYNTETSLRNTIRINHLLPLSEISDNNSLLESWDHLYKDIEDISNQNMYLQPLKINPYWNAKKAYEWWVTPELITDTSLSKICFCLGISHSKGSFKELISWIKSSEDGFMETWEWTWFIAHWRYYIMQAKPRFWEKEPHLEKKITLSGMQNFWKYWIDIHDSKLIGSTIRFPQEWDTFHGKLFTKWCINHKIPLFWRNVLPLAEKDGKIISVFEPHMLMF